MLLLVALVIGLVAGIATGGKVGNLAHLNLRWPWLVIAALIVRVKTQEVPFVPSDVVSVKTNCVVNGPVSVLDVT